MSHGMVNKGKISRCRAVLPLVVGCILVVSVAGAQDPQGLTGEWRGSLETPLVPVNLTIGTMEQGKKDTILHYGTPRNCKLTAEYSGEQAGNQIFSFFQSTGGVCDKFLAGRMAARLEGEATLMVDVTYKEKAESFQLKK